MRCRKAGALQLAGSLEGFWVSLRSERNPSDRPSRIYELAHRAKPKQEPLPRVALQKTSAAPVPERSLSGHAALRPFLLGSEKGR